MRKIGTSCGCVLCDIEIPPDRDGIHHLRGGEAITCKRLQLR